jgi:hypothetical protein
MIVQPYHEACDGSSASPLDNIRNLRDVVAVFQAGERVVGA